VLHSTTKLVASVLVTLDANVVGISRKSSPLGDVIQQFNDVNRPSVVVHAPQRFRERICYGVDVRT